jgi:MFS family permease
MLDWLVTVEGPGHTGPGIGISQGESMSAATDTDETGTTGTAGFTRHQVAVVILLLGAGFMLSADFSILNVAAPSIGRGIGLPLKELPWVTSAYALPAAGFALLFGRVADLVGRRNLFMFAMVLLTLASVLGGLAGNPTVLFAARALQGLSSAMAIPSGLAMLATTFEEGPQREKVFGANGALQSGGFTFGALAGGALVSIFSWRAAFLVNVPFAVVILAVAPLLLQESRLPERKKLDLPGAVTVTAGLVGIIFGVLQKNWIVLGAGVVLLVVFWWIESRSSQPLAPVHILKRPTIKWTNYGGLIFFMSLTSMIFVMTLYLQDVVGFSAIQAGVALGLPGIASTVAGIIAGSLIGKVGNVRLFVIAMTVQALGILPLAFIGTSKTVLFVVIPCLVVSFFAHVSAIVAYTVTGTSGLSNDEQGLATGLLSMTQQVAITTGTPILVAIAAASAVEATGIHRALLVDVLVTLVSAGVVGLGLRNSSTKGEVGQGRGAGRR